MRQHFPMVVEALGYDEYNIYGVSYGTLVAQHLVRGYPEGIRSVALNAVMTPGSRMSMSVFRRVPNAISKSSLIAARRIQPVRSIILTWKQYSWDLLKL